MGSHIRKNSRTCKKEFKDCWTGYKDLKKTNLYQRVAFVLKMSLALAIFKSTWLQMNY